MSTRGAADDGGARMESMQRTSKRSSMKSTKMSEVHLAVHPTGPRQNPRMAERRLRVALAAVITKTPMPRHAWDDNARTEPRSAIACERERTMLHDAIRQGCTTPERVVEYYMLRLEDSLSQFDETPLLEELCYQAWAKEHCEATDAVSLAHMLPTPQHRERAIREVSEASLVGRALCAVLRRGRSLLHQVS